MKIIIAVTFFGILTFAFAEYPTEDTEECLNLQDYEGFNSTKFLKGTWFVTHARYGSNYTVCREYKTRLRKNGSINLVADGYYSYRGEPKYFRVRCEGTKDKSGKNENGKFSLKCKQQSRGRENKIVFVFQLELTVVKTDYCKFAVLYRCATFPPENGQPKIEDNLLILHRKKEDIDPQVENVLKLYESSLEKFLSRKENKCLPSPVQNKKKKTKE
uniref:Tm816 triabin-like lipocalin n=1 Tax=Triatoma matogrossensis TaxID=162370 RepID=E2J767_9HEMI